MPFDDQILLLPRHNYWEWLQACRGYVLTFGPNITPDPGVAARYMAPRQVVTFPHFEGGFPEIGHPLAWFRQSASGVRLDPVEADSPSSMAAALQRRVEENDRYGARRRTFHLLWPTDFPVVTQPFGVNPQVYRRYGMPGHEGVDFRALTNTNVYACADGEVYQVYTDPKNHAYGIHVRIQHADGYRTVYAHLAKALVHTGDPVHAGQLIGRADSTGNSSAAHLHLSLKRDGATARQETIFPKDIIDPTPFLVWPAPVLAKAAKQASSTGPRLGVNLAHPGAIGQDELEGAGRIGAQVVMMAQAEAAATVEALRAKLPGARLIARVGDSPTVDSAHAARFAARGAGEVGRLYRLGIRDFELAPFANEHRGGFGRLWPDGAGFGDWFAAVLRRLREVFPEARFGYPCLAAGGKVTGRQQDGIAFLDQSSAAAGEADWIGVACDVAAPSDVLAKCLADFPEKPLLVTEVFDARQATDPEEQAIRLAAFLRNLRHPAIEAVLIRLRGQDRHGGDGGGIPWEAMEILADAAGL